MVVGLSRVYRCVDMKGLGVEGQQLGAAQTETIAQLQKSKHSRGCRVRGAHALPCDCWHFETKVTTLTKISGENHLGGGVGGGTDTRRETIFWIQCWSWGLRLWASGFRSSRVQSA